jgi:hypothetical protein
MISLKARQSVRIHDIENDGGWLAITYLGILLAWRVGLLEVEENS